MSPLLFFLHHTTDLGRGLTLSYRLSEAGGQCATDEEVVDDNADHATISGLTMGTHQ